MGAPAFDGRMPRRPATITELAFFVCGILIIFVGWISDLFGLFEVGSSGAGHGLADKFPLRLFMTMSVVAFATIGIGFENLPQFLIDTEAATRYIVVILFLQHG